MHKNTLISFTLIIFFYSTSAQQALIAPVSYIDTIQNNKQLTVMYDISINLDKKKPGIEETYNGGNKTVFISGDYARVRLVSLMRIQSIFFFPVNVNGKNISVIKESGKKKYKYFLSNNEWKSNNKKYDSLHSVFAEDSIQILNYNCKKALVTLEDGKELSIYYTTLIKPVSALIEPAFRDIPGLVLQYSYTTKKGSMTYTASKISENSIDPSLFKIPAKGYITKKFYNNTSVISTSSDNTDDIE